MALHRMHSFWSLADVPVALATLLAHPLLVWGVGTAAMAWGVPPTPLALTVLTLLN